MQHVGSIRSRLFPDSDNTAHFKNVRLSPNYWSVEFMNNNVQRKCMFKVWFSLYGYILSTLAKFATWWTRIAN
mgnify:CR=1 FL=1